jgi:general L-amino acid transport system permease protein
MPRTSTLVQTLLFVALVIAAALLLQTAHQNLQRQNIASGFGFLFSRTGWDLGASLLSHSPNDPYWWTLLAGLLNTIVLSIVCIVLSTVFGLLLALAGGSSSRILSAGTSAYVWLFRNIPILVQLFFWYHVTRQFPPVRQAIAVFDCCFISNRGVYVPSLAVSYGVTEIVLLGAVAVGAAVLLVLVNRRRTKRGDDAFPRTALAAVWLVAVLLAGAVLTHASFDVPRLRGFNFAGGTYLSPEFCALVLAIVAYNTAFVAEIVRAGIRSIPRGQIEAARMIGLSNARIFWKIVVPQALRVAVPPLTNQYISIAKSSSLAIAIGYTDLFSVGAVAINHTGQSIEIIAVLMVVYLTISSGLSAAGNWYNRSILSRASR